jgi:hypothetical protein
VGAKEYSDAHSHASTDNALSDRRYELDRRLYAVEATEITMRHIRALGKKPPQSPAFRCGMRTQPEGLPPTAAQ